MTCFAVIQVHADYDYIEDAVCLAAFSLESEALAFIEDERNKVNDSHRARREYISNYVDKNVKMPVLDEEKYQEYEKYQRSTAFFYGEGIPPPKIDYQKWRAFLKPFAPFGTTPNITGVNFMHEFKHYLYNGEPAPACLVDFDPPKPIYGMNNLFCVKVDNAEVSG